MGMARGLVRDLCMERGWILAGSGWFQARCWGWQPRGTGLQQYGLVEGSESTSTVQGPIAESSTAIICWAIYKECFWTMSSWNRPPCLSYGQE
ncbi:hypothetical protein F751_0943 [Auxenochlorella protothecoides]|uniref:Uncharacterized protein n=1 Tax=Auxenochlorella protothecoides TaxID=3075 RepID=A0A087SDC5_AUXPR|nr:hypothetical protein F751_0943 [Auxenochlorella protothecoides]KFM23729.1 hypothetical protein F751_0943 [Auxenochlorella protothecoides]